jgi:FtsH-binding integral membrane protein|tara:strand:- start:264 stop:533 length:270 start_codon:yes stop_codon:yes gene_type:complete
VSRNRDFKIRGYTIGQAPNLPLIVVIVASVVARMTEQGSAVNRISEAVFFVGLSIWSYLEAFDGANALRRALGIAGFVVVLTRLVGQLQ